MEVREVNTSALPVGMSRAKLVGEQLKDFWMWTRKVTEYKDGTKQFKTVKVVLLREAAFHFWKDGWMPMEPITEEFLRKMEQALRSHPGLQMQNVQFPNGEFLEMPQALPEGIVMPGVKINSTPIGALNPEELDAVRAAHNAN